MSCYEFKATQGIHIQYTPIVVLAFPFFFNQQKKEFYYSLKQITNIKRIRGKMAPKREKTDIPTIYIGIPALNI